MSAVLLPLATMLLAMLGIGRQAGPTNTPEQRIVALRRYIQARARSQRMRLTTQSVVWVLSPAASVPQGPAVAAVLSGPTGWQPPVLRPPLRVRPGGVYVSARRLWWRRTRHSLLSFGAMALCTALMVLGGVGLIASLGESLAHLLHLYFAS
jgi:hypothetical protein